MRGRTIARRRAPLQAFNSTFVHPEPASIGIVATPAMIIRDAAWGGFFMTNSSPDGFREGAAPGIGPGQARHSVANAVATKTELAALAAVDGTPTQPKMLPEIKSRLIGLYLIERREWPNGPLWRTPKGDRRARARK